MAYQWSRACGIFFMEIQKSVGGSKKHEIKLMWPRHRGFGTIVEASLVLVVKKIEDLLGQIGLCHSLRVRPSPRHPLETQCIKFSYEALRHSTHQPPPMQIMSSTLISHLILPSQGKRANFSICT